MADDIDRANALIDIELDMALGKMRQNAMNSQEGAEFCSECGDKMLAERRKLGFKLCVPCAQESERKKSLYAEY